MIDNGFEWLALLALYVGVGLYKASMILGKFNGTIEPEDEESKERLQKLQSKTSELGSLIGPVPANAFLSLILLLVVLAWPLRFFMGKLKALLGLFKGKRGRDR